MTRPSHDSPLAAFGYDDAVARAMAGQEGEPARVLVDSGAGYVVVTASGSARASLSGTVQRAARRAPAERPVVGDWVRVQGEARGALRIEALLPRRSAFVRRAAGSDADAQVIAANADFALIVEPLVPAANVRRIERYIALAHRAGARPVVVLTKADSAEDAEAQRALVSDVAAGASVWVVSAQTGAGLDDVRSAFAAGRTGVLVGPSGAGKSTLLNTLMGEERQKTAPMRKHGKGRHTTTRRELLQLPCGGLLIDTPGTREVGLVEDPDSEPAEALASAFPEVALLAEGCRFTDCTHGREPGCEVRRALDDGRLPPDRFTSWQRLSRELVTPGRR